VLVITEFVITEFHCSCYKGPNCPLEGGGRGVRDSSPESNGSKNVSKKKTTFAVEEKKLRELLNDENEIEGDHGQSRKH